MTAKNGQKTPPRRALGYQDQNDLAEVDLQLAAAEREVDPFGRGERMLPEEAQRRGLSALVNLSRARRLLAELLGRPRRERSNSANGGSDGG